MVFQNYALYPHKTVAENMGFALKLRRAPKAEIEQRVRRAAEILDVDDAARPLSAPAFRRAAPAGGDGAGDRARSAGVPVRRAALEPRRQAARADAGRDQGIASAAEDDDDLCHPRSDRGDDDGRPHRGLARRRRRAGRGAARSLRSAGEPLRRRLHRLAVDESPQRNDPRERLAELSKSTAASACRWRRRPPARTAAGRSTASGPSISF